MPKLVIVESPTKAKTLKGILGNEYDIKASMGHIRDLPKSGLGVDVEKNFEPEYTVPDKAKKTLTELKKSAKDSEEIILATDPDREGEAIAWHLEELLKPSKKKNDIVFSRVVFHELTKGQLMRHSNIRVLDMHLVDSQQAREGVRQAGWIQTVLHYCGKRLDTGFLQEEFRAWQ
jgi:DNA topoisomerase-1